MTVLPSTTCELSERPLKAATVRVVRLFAAAIDHSVSPGWTTWETAADAPEGTTRKAPNRTADNERRRKIRPPCEGSDTHQAAPHPRQLKGVRARLRERARDVSSSADAAARRPGHSRTVARSRDAVPSSGGRRCAAAAG